MTANQFSKARFLLEPTLALAVYSIVALIFLGSALSSQGRLVIGNDESDVWKHLWGAWWMGSELQQGRFPIWTDLQNFPAGGHLYIIDPLNALCTALLKPIFGLVQSYNITQTLQLLAASLAAWGLTRWITKNFFAALVAGLIYGFCPFILSSGISSGIDETSNLAWLPLSILGLMLCLNGEHPRWGILLGGLGLALSAIGSWYFGMAAGLVWIITLGWCAISQRVPAGNSPKVNWLYPILSGLLAIILALPLAVIFAQSLKGESSLLGRVNITERQEQHHLEFMYRTGDFKNNAIMTGYFLPGKDKISMATDVDRRMKTVYIGLIALTLALIGLYKEKRRSYFWLLCSLIMGVLSLGPYLAISPTLTLAKPWSPPYLLAYYAIPGFRMVAICDRLSIGVQLSIAVLASLGMLHILPQNKKWGFCVSLAISIGIITELICISPLPWPLPTSEAKVPELYKQLANEPKRLGLISLPLNRQTHTLQPGEYYYWQTVHEKPQPIALTTRFPEEMMENRLVGTLYLCEDDSYTTPPEAEVLVKGLEELRSQGFGWIVVNGDIAGAKAAAKANKLLTSLLGKPRVCAHDYLYDLHSSQADKWMKELRTVESKRSSK